VTSMTGARGRRQSAPASVRMKRSANRMRRAQDGQKHGGQRRDDQGGQRPGTQKQDSQGGQKPDGRRRDGQRLGGPKQENQSLQGECHGLAQRRHRRLHRPRLCQPLPRPPRRTGCRPPLARRQCGPYQSCPLRWCVPRQCPRKTREPSTHPQYGATRRSQGLNAKRRSRRRASPKCSKLRKNQPCHLRKQLDRSGSGRKASLDTGRWQTDQTKDAQSFSALKTSLDMQRGSSPRRG
jgi:hypothetical protein